MSTNSLARRVARVGDDREHRLAQVLDDAERRAVAARDGGQDRIVVHDRAALVLAGDVLRADDIHHAGQRPQLVQCDALQPAVRQR
jgi:hypothetical protein